MPEHSLWQRNGRSISPSNRPHNFKLKLGHFLPNLLAACQTLCGKKKASHPVLEKNLHEYVDEIDPLSVPG